VTKNGDKTPIRAALVPRSVLLPRVEDGMGALKRSHESYIEESLRPAFADSLDIDEAFREGHENENRWDYLLGHAASARIYALEPHSAFDSEVSTVIRKRLRAREHLQSHLKPNARIADWFWVASGKVDFTAHDKTVNLLANNGIAFVGKRLLPKKLGLPEPKKERKTR
jgi:hypothetical protein